MKKAKTNMAWLADVDENINQGCEVLKKYEELESKMTIRLDDDTLVFLLSHVDFDYWQYVLSNPAGWENIDIEKLQLMMAFVKKKRGEFFFHKKNNKKNKKIIIVDDDEDVLFTYRSFLKDYVYDITCFTDPILALNHIREIPTFDDLLIILDIRMKNLNGLQLHQQIKAIDPTIKILFITALDILDEFSTIIPGIPKEQIMRKPVDKMEFTNTVKNLLK